MTFSRSKRRIAGVIAYVLLLLPVWSFFMPKMAESLYAFMELVPLIRHVGLFDSRGSFALRWMLFLGIHWDVVLVPTLAGLIIMGLTCLPEFRREKWTALGIHFVCLIMAFSMLAVTWVGFREIREESRRSFFEYQGYASERQGDQNS